MSNSSHTTRSLLHRLGVAGVGGPRFPARVFPGTGAPKSILATLTMTLTALALTAAPALGYGTHLYSSSFGEPCTTTPCGPGQFSEPAGVAVNESTHDVYVVDKGNNRVEYFNEKGGYEGEFDSERFAATGTIILEPTLSNARTTIEVVSTDIGAFQLGDEIEGEGIQVGTKISYALGDGVFVISKPVESSKYGQSVEATAHRSLDDPEAIAVDNSCFLHKTPAAEKLCKETDPSAGDVYVTDTGSKVVEKFSATGAYLGEITTGEHLEVHVGDTRSLSGELVEFKILGVAVGVTGVVSVYQGTKTEIGSETGPSLTVPGEVDSYSDGEPNKLIASIKTQDAKAKKGEGEVSQPGFAVDSQGNLYVAHVDVVAGDVAELNSEGAVIGGENFGDPAYMNGESGLDTTMLAVELSSNDVYMDNWGTAKIERRSSSGSLIESFGSKQLGQNRHAEDEPDSLGVAVSSVGGDVYISNTLTDEVEKYVPVPGPDIGKEQVTGVAGTAATLQAEINPDEVDTKYHFEYDTSSYTSGASHGTSLPEPNADVGSGGVSVPVSVQLEGLQPDTSYYYRVVAESDVETSSGSGIFETKQFYGPDQVLTTLAPPSSPPEGCANAQARAEQPFGLTLPDCRAYEMVSPLYKGDSDATVAEDDAPRSAVSGDAFTYKSKGLFAGALGGWNLTQYLARRGPGGWSDQAITPASAGATGLESAFGGMVFTPELSAGVAATNTPLESEALAGVWNLYVTDFASTPASYQLVTRESHESNGPQVALGGTADLSSVVYQEPQAAAGHEFFEWANGEQFPLAGAGGGDQQPGNDTFNDSWRSVSADGSRVFFTPYLSAINQAVSPDRQVEVEENPTSPVEDCSEAEDRCILEVSKSQRKKSEPLGPGSARFRGASVNGSRVFFTDCSKLTEDATAVAEEPVTRCFPSAKTGNDLYEYDLETGVLTDLTVDPGDPLGAQVVGVPYISEGGEYVYFVAEGTLAGVNAEGEQPAAGEPNLYVAHLEGGSWSTSFVATLAPSTEVNAEGLQIGGDSGVWNRMSPLDAVRATPDGTRLAFVSKRSLTGYDNEQAETGECENNERGVCPEIFSYDAVSGKLVCVSCAPSGVLPVGPSSFGPVQNGTNEDQSELMGYTSRSFSENGGRLFFDSGDTLVLHDSDGRLNVYEWERSGEGSCTEASSAYVHGADGCVVAISDAAGDYESFFLDADAKGENVFFATEDQLVPADTDNHVDVYDARVGGGFPVMVPAPECDNGDSCKPPVSPQPQVFGAPGSATFSGPGNPAPAVVSPLPKKTIAKKTVKCKKPMKLSHGKCVKSKKKANKAKKAKRASDDRRAH